MFYSIKELVEQADLDFQGNVAELMIATEYQLTGRERAEVLLLMERNLEVMKASVELGLSENKSRSGLTGGDAAKLDRHLKSGKALSDFTILSAARNAIAVNEHNAKMGLVCATPTAGSAGCLPAVLTAAIQKLDLSHEEQLDFLFAAGAFGLVIANNASISGAEGGCQAEVGSASAMSAAALTLAAGGTPYQASQAIAFVIKNMLGLICDPVAGWLKFPVLSAMPWEPALPLSQQTWPWQVSSLRSLLTKSSMPCTKSDQASQLPFVKRPRVDSPLHLLVAAYKKKSLENKFIY